MNPSKPVFSEYNKYLLNKSTVTRGIKTYIETLSINNDTSNYSFHKILVKQWVSSLDTLFNTMADYFTSALVPIRPYSQDEVVSFWTSNLNLILKIIKYDFKFYYERGVIDIDVIFDDKTAIELFNKFETENDIVSDVVSSRYNDVLELDLSDFRNDPKFLKKKIEFYNINVLSYFKSIMLKVGKQSTSLNLSKNNLRKPPTQIFNFFINGDLNSIDLSYNDISCLSDVLTIDFCNDNRKIRKLWLEGNPLCDELDPFEYVKKVTSKFPRLYELDGVRLNLNRSLAPFHQHYLATPDTCTKLLVEKFLLHYFKAYDEPRRPKLIIFYHNNAKLSISTRMTGSQQCTMPHYRIFARNACNANIRMHFNETIHKPRGNLMNVLKSLPDTIHNPTSFNVDLIRHEKLFIVLVIDGIYFEVKPNVHVPFKFRRTLTIKLLPYNPPNPLATCTICNDMLFVTPMRPCRTLQLPQQAEEPEHPFALIDPTPEEKKTVIDMFCTLTTLNRSEAVQHLQAADWDYKKAVIKFSEAIDSKEIQLENCDDELVDTEMDQDFGTSADS